jgi:hypothetical protein
MSSVNYPIPARLKQLRRGLPRYGPALAYAALASLVLAPVLTRGYVLTLDMVFTPRLRLPTTVGNNYLFLTFLHLLNYLLPGDIIEKLILLATLFLAGLGMHYLLAKTNQSPDDRQSIGCYLAGMLYTINPFTYDRLMAGQYQVLLGYALLPWFGRTLLSFLRQPTVRRASRLITWALLISIVSIHAIGLIMLLTVVVVGVEIWRQRADRAWLIRAGRLAAVSLVIVLLASSYWLWPLLAGHGQTAAELGSFSGNDQTSFRTLGGSLVGQLGNILRLQGFWAEGRDLYTLPQDQTAFFGLLECAIWALLILGAVRLWRHRQRAIVGWFGAVGCTAALLGTGRFNDWLAAHLPLFAGYREPEKFAALVALSFAIFAGHGTTAVIAAVRQRSGSRRMAATIGLLLLAVPLLWTPVMLWAGNSQLVAAEYPAGWFAVNRRLNADPGHFQVLFLPWHLYMSFDFEGRIIANPAPQFFDKPVIIDNDPQFAGVPPLPDARASHLNATLASAAKNKNLTAQLAPYRVKYIVLALDDDYGDYAYLGKQPGLQLVLKNTTMELYQVTEVRRE